MRKGGFGAFAAMERERKAARASAARAAETDAANLEPVGTTASEAASVPWPRPYSLRADAESGQSPSPIADGLTPQGPQ